MRRELDTEFDQRSGAWFGRSLPIDRNEMESRVWRFKELTPSPRAFLDCTLPGHVRTLYSALGRGTDDEQLEGTAVESAENYHIDFVKADPGNGAVLHSHGSKETFIALTGTWDVFFGETKAKSVYRLNRSTASWFRPACSAAFETPAAVKPYCWLCSDRTMSGTASGPSQRRSRSRRGPNNADAAADGLIAPSSVQLFALRQIRSNTDLESIPLKD